MRDNDSLQSITLKDGDASDLPVNIAQVSIVSPDAEGEVSKTLSMAESDVEGGH